MESSDRKEKRVKFNEMLRRYTEMGEELYQLSVDLGYGTNEEKHIPEFRDILNPAGFYVYHADKIESAERDMFVLKVGRKTPKFYNEGISSRQDNPAACPGESHCQGVSLMGEDEALAVIEQATKILVKHNWRIITAEKTERQFLRDGENLRSLKLELAKGPLTTRG